MQKTVTVLVERQVKHAPVRQVHQAFDQAACP
jgi:ribosomal protein S17